HYKNDWLRSYQSVQALGREFAAKNPGYFEAEIEKGKPGDVAIICYTSGTTGNPKGVMLTHSNAIALAESFRKADDVRPEDDALAFKRSIFEHFLSAAERAEILRADGKPVPVSLRLACMIGNVLVYTPIRDQLGLRRAKWALTGGAPLGPDTFRFFRSIGVNLKQVYGSTETTGLVSLQPSAEANPTTAGRPCPGIEVKIADRGEVLVRGPVIFKG